MKSEEIDTASKPGDYSKGDLSGFSEMDKNKTDKDYRNGYSQAGSTDSQSLGRFSGFSWFRRGVEDQHFSRDDALSLEKDENKESETNSSKPSSKPSNSEVS